MPGAASAVTVIRADDHTYHYRSDKDCQIRTLSPLNLEKDVEFYEFGSRPAEPCAARRTSRAPANSSPCRKGGFASSRLATPKNSLPATRPATAPMSPTPLNSGRGEATLFLIVIYR